MPLIKFFIFLKTVACNNAYNTLGSLNKFCGIHSFIKIVLHPVHIAMPTVFQPLFKPKGIVIQFSGFGKTALVKSQLKCFRTDMNGIFEGIHWDRDEILDVRYEN